VGRSTDANKEQYDEKISGYPISSHSSEL